MLQKLKTLQTLLGAKDLILTGSTALAYHGLLEFTESNDLDLILVNPTATEEEILKRLQDAEPSPKHRTGSPVNYSFLYEGVKVDIWVQSAHKEKEYTFNSDGVKISSVKHIVEAKVGYNRPKDWLQLMQLSAKIFDPEKFKKVLPTVKTSDNSGYPDEEE